MSLPFRKASRANLSKALENPSPAFTNVGSVRQEVAEPKKLNGSAKKPPHTQTPVNVATSYEQKQLETSARKCETSSPSRCLTDMPKAPESESTPGIVGAALNKAVEVKASKKPAGNSVYSQTPARAVASVGSQQAGTPARKCELGPSKHFELTSKLLSMARLTRVASR